MDCIARASFTHTPAHAATPPPEAERHENRLHCAATRAHTDAVASVWSHGAAKFIYGVQVRLRLNPDPGNELVIVSRYAIAIWGGSFPHPPPHPPLPSVDEVFSSTQTFDADFQHIAADSPRVKRRCPAAHAERSIPGDFAAICQPCLTVSPLPIPARTRRIT